MSRDNIYLPKMCRILKVTEQTEDIKTFRLDHRVKHAPGQFFEVSVFNFGEVPISISSYSDEYVEISVRRVGRVTNAIHRLKEGDTLGIRGPYGRGYPMKEIECSNLNIIGGGCGIAPLGGVIEYVEKHRGKYGEVNVFLGCRTPKDMLFKDRIPEWGKEKFRIYQTVDEGTSEWKCDTGVITKLLDKIEIKNENSYALTCGPPVMIKYVIRLLKEKKKFKDEQIYISLERYMKCGVGKCGHCMVNDKYVCKDGPVFRYDEGRFLED